MMKRTADAAGISSTLPGGAPKKAASRTANAAAAAAAPPGPTSVSQPKMHGSSRRGSALVQSVGGASIRADGGGGRSSTSIAPPPAAPPPAAPPPAALLPDAAAPPRPPRLPHGVIAPSSKPQPAFQLVAAASERPEPLPPLPAEYKLLRECFAALERAIPLMRARGLPLLFGLLTGSVERATSRECTPSTLAAILGVWPEAYKLEVVDVKLSEQRARMMANPGQKRDWILEQPAAAAAAAAATTAAAAAATMAATATAAATPAAAAATASSSSSSTASAAPAARLAEFSQRLGALVRAHEAAWRLSHPPREGGGGVAGAVAFPLDHCAPPPEAPLPPLLREAPPPRLTPAANASRHAQPSAAPPTAAPSVPPPATPAAPVAVASHVSVPAGCAGLSSALVAKVLQRQAEVKVRTDAEPALELSTLLKRLPDVAVAVRSCMHEADKRLMRVDELVRKLMLNLKWLTCAEELREQIRLATEVAPSWIKLVTANKQPAVRLDTTLRFPQVLKAFKEVAARGTLSSASASGGSGGSSSAAGSS